MAKTCYLGLNQQQGDESGCGYSNKQETSAAPLVKKYILDANYLPIVRNGFQ
jgi:hypothetical protein